MSITLGIYDVFSYAIPGMLYLFTFNEAFRLFSWPHLTIMNLGETGVIILLGLASYLIGHIFVYISHRLWYRLFYHQQMVLTRAYTRFKRIPGVKAEFDLNQWSILFGVIRRNDHEVADSIDKSKATAIMLRNVSFALVLLAGISLLNLFLGGFSTVSAAGFLAALIGSYVSMRQSDTFNVWFYLSIFEQSVVYGNNLSEILHNTRPRAEKSTDNSARTQSKQKPKGD